MIISFIELANFFHFLNKNFKKEIFCYKFFICFTSIAPIFEKESEESTEDLKWSVYSLVVTGLVFPITKKNAGI